MSEDKPKSPSEAKRGTPTPPQTGKWKPKLLASGLPLEFEAAKLLVSQGYSIRSDYSYHRLSDGRDLEFSVDIRATHWTPSPDQSEHGCQLDLLVECKQRTRPVVWLFLPDVGGRRNFHSNDFVRGVDAFSRWSLTDLAWWTGPVSLHACYKGIEIDLNTGHVDAAELRHGLLQLQFALPVLLRSRLDSPATSVENMPILFAAVILTNAPLVVAHRNLSSAEVEKAREITDLGEQVDCLILRVGTGRDFFQHCQRHFAGFKDTVTRKSIKAAEEHRRSQGVNPRLLPSAIADRISVSGEAIEILADFEPVVVCAIQHFPVLLRRFTELADRVGKTASLETPKHLKF